MREKVLALAVALVLLTVLATLRDVTVVSGPGCDIMADGPCGEVPGDVRCFDGLDGQFTENLGQLGEGAGHYYARGYPLSAAFGDGWVAFNLQERGAGSLGGVMFRVTFVGANRVTPVGVDPVEHESNFLRGNDPDRWLTGVRNYREVVYPGLYERIDLRYYFEEDMLKYDFVVGPGGDPSRIRLAFAGVRELSVEETTGDLMIGTTAGTIREGAPVAYHETSREEPRVMYAYRGDAGSDVAPCGFRLVDGSTVAFDVEGHDVARTLVIDPGLVFSTFLGGASQERGNDVVLDPSGNVYVAGFTWSGDFPTTVGAYDEAHNSPGYYDAFVLKMDPTGSSLIYSTFVGGGSQDVATHLWLEDSGRVIVVGYTYSGDFPATYVMRRGGANDMFVLKLSDDGSDIVYSTIIGGDHNEGAADIWVEASGCIWLTGWVDSPDFPVTEGAIDTTHNNPGGNDVFLMKLDPSGTGLLYSTFIGGGGNDGANAFVRDEASGSVLIAGVTASPDFPLTDSAYDATHNGGQDLFVMRLNPSCDSIQYSTLVGGGANDVVIYGGLFLDPSGDVCVYGATYSPDFPTTADAYDTTFGGLEEMYLLCLDPTLHALEYSTFIGGSGHDRIYGGQVLEGSGLLYLTGRTSSDDFPVTGTAYDGDYNGGDFDVYVIVAETSPFSIVYSTYVGGTGSDGARDLFVDGEGRVYVTGGVYSPDFPTTPGAHDETFDGVMDAFVLELEVPTPWTCRWGTGADMPTPRNVPSSAVLNGEIYVISGNAGWGYYRSKVVEAYNPVTDTWSVKASTHHDGGLGNAVSLGGCIYFIGGGYHSTYFNDNERYDPTTDTWSQMAPMPTARNGFGIAVLEGRIYTIGGYSFDGSDHYHDVVEIYDPATDSWSPGIPMVQGQAYTSATALDGKIYALSHGFEVFDPTVGAWRVLSAPAGYRVQGGAGKNIQALDGRIYGFEHGSTQVYDPVADEWEELEGCLMPTPRSAFTTSVYGDLVYVIGGDLPGTTNHMASNEYFDASAIGGGPRVEIVSAEFQKGFYGYGEDVDVGFGIANVGWLGVEDLAVHVDVIDPSNSIVASGVIANGLSLEPGETYQSDWVNVWTVPLGAANGEYSMEISVWDRGEATLLDSEVGIDSFHVLTYDLEVPYFFQFDTHWCVPSSMSMILSYHGLNLPPWRIAGDWNLPVDEGVDWSVIGLGSANWIVESYFLSHGLGVDYIFGEFHSDAFNHQWVLHELASDRPVMFTAWADLPNGGYYHSVVITGYVRTDAGECFLVNDPSGLFVTDFAGVVGPESWPFIDVRVPVPVFVNSNLYFSYYHSVSGAPSPRDATLNPIHESAFELSSEWEGATETYFTTLDEGINWVDGFPYSEMYPTIVSYGDAEVDVQTVLLINHHADERNYHVYLSIEREGGDSGYPGRDWDYHDDCYLVVGGKAAAGINQGVLSPNGTAFDPLFPADVSNLQSGHYDLSLWILDMDREGPPELALTLPFTYDVPPTAVAGVDRTLVVGEVSEFDASESSDDGVVLSWCWHFGDGTGAAQGETVQHSYSSSGEFTVTLTVEDDYGVRSTDRLTVNVITPSQAIEEVIDIIEAIGLDEGVENSLDRKLECTLDSLVKGNNDAAMNQLEAFINEVEAQRGKKLTAEQADLLVEWADRVIDNI